MSRTGSTPVTIEKDAKVEIQGSEITFTGPKGELKLTLPDGIVAEVNENNEIVVETKKKDKDTLSLWGTYRSLIANCIKGVTEGFQKKLEISGVGFRVKMNGSDIEMSLGLNHPIIVQAPEGITFEVPDEVTIFVKGHDKQLVGQVAARIREYHKTEPYKGKGIRYEGEHVRRKSAKKATV